jgi:hypothetical protein
LSKTIPLTFVCAEIVFAKAKNKINSVNIFFMEKKTSSKVFFDEVQI